MSRPTAGFVLAPQMGNRCSLRAVAGVASLCAIASSLFAQAPPHPRAEVLFAPSLAKGTRVRVVVSGAAGQTEAPISGALRSLQGDTVTISASWSGASRSIVLDRGRRLEVAARGDRHGEAGAAIGAAVGALGGAAIGANTRPGCPSGHICLVELSAGQRTLIGAGVGALGGALVGFLLGRGERSETWVPVETAGLRIALAPGGNGFGAAFSF
jgi:hypothetical protein